MTFLRTIFLSNAWLVVKAIYSFCYVASFNRKKNPHAVLFNRMKFQSLQNAIHNQLYQEKNLYLHHFMSFFASFAFYSTKKLNKLFNLIYNTNSYFYMYIFMTHEILIELFLFLFFRWVEGKSVIISLLDSFSVFLSHIQ